MRRTGTLIASLALALALTGCSSSGADPTESATTTDEATATSTPTEESTASVPADELATEDETLVPDEELEDTTEGPTAEPAGVQVELTADGVGGVPWDEPGATAEITDLLGTPDGVDIFPPECGVTDVEQLSYGGVVINLQADALFSWTVTDAEPVPDTIGLPDDVTVGSPWSAATGLPGAQPVDFLENYQVYQVEVIGSGTDRSLFYWAEDDSPASPIVLVAGSAILGCG